MSSNFFNVGNTLEALNNAKNQVAEQNFQNALENIQDTANEKLTLYGDIEKGSGTLLGGIAGTKAVIGGIKKLKTKISDLKNLRKNKGKSLEERDAEDGLDNDADQAEQGIDGLTDNLNETAENLTSNLTENLSSVTDNVAQAGQRILSNVGNSAENIVSNATNTIQEGVNTATETLQNGMNGVINNGRNILDTLIKGQGGTDTPQIEMKTFTKVEGRSENFNESANVPSETVEEQVQPLTRNQEFDKAYDTFESYNAQEVPSGSEYLSYEPSLEPYRNFTKEIKMNEMDNIYGTNKANDYAAKYQDQEGYYKLKPEYKADGGASKPAPDQQTLEQRRMESEDIDAGEKEPEDFPDLPDADPENPEAGVPFEDPAGEFGGTQPEGIANITTDTSFGVPETSTALETGAEVGGEIADEAIGSALDATGVGALIGIPLQILGLVGAGAGVLTGIFGSDSASSQETQATQQAQKAEAQAKALPANVAGKFAPAVQSQAQRIVGGY